MFQPTTMPAFILKVKGQELFLGARSWCRMLTEPTRVLRTDAIWWNESSVKQFARRVNNNLSNNCNYYIDDDMDNPLQSARGRAIQVEVVALNATFSVA